MTIETEVVQLHKHEASPLKTNAMIINSRSYSIHVYRHSWSITMMTAWHDEQVKESRGKRWMMKKDILFVQIYRLERHLDMRGKNDECLFLCVWDSQVLVSLADSLSDIPIPSHQSWNECQWNQWIHEWISTTKSGYTSSREKQSSPSWSRRNASSFSIHESLFILLSCVSLHSWRVPVSGLIKFFMCPDSHDAFKRNFRLSLINALASVCLQRMEEVAKVTQDEMNICARGFLFILNGNTKRDPLSLFLSPPISFFLSSSDTEED